MDDLDDDRFAPLTESELVAVPVAAMPLRITVGRPSCRSPMASGCRTCWLKMLPLRLFDQVGVAISDPNWGLVRLRCSV